MRNLFVTKLYEAELGDEAPRAAQSFNTEYFEQ